MSDLVTYCRKHDVAVYPDAGKKYLAGFHERHKDCGRQVMSKVRVGAKELRAICNRAYSDSAGLQFALEWAEKAEEVALGMQARIDALEAGIRETIAATQLSKVARITGEATIHPFFVDKLAALLEASDGLD